MEPTLIKKCSRPNQPGTYLCARQGVNGVNTELVEIRVEYGKLIYVGKVSIFPLGTLEKTANFWGPITLGS